MGFLCACPMRCPRRSPLIRRKGGLSRKEQRWTCQWGIPCAILLLVWSCLSWRGQGLRHGSGWLSGACHRLQIFWLCGRQWVLCRQSFEHWANQAHEHYGKSRITTDESEQHVMHLRKCPHLEDSREPKSTEIDDLLEMLKHRGVRPTSFTEATRQRLGANGKVGAWLRWPQLSVAVNSC